MFTIKERLILTTALHAEGVSLDPKERGTILAKLASFDDASAAHEQLALSTAALQETKIKALTETLEAAVAHNEQIRDALAGWTRLAATLAEFDVLTEDAQPSLSDAINAAQAMIANSTQIQDTITHLLRVASDDN